MKIDDLLSQLTDPSPDGAGARLADVIVDGWLAQTPRKLLAAGPRPRLALQALSTAAASPVAAQWAGQAFEHGLAWLESQKKPLNEILPAEAVAALRKLAQQPFTPDRALLVHLLGREPFRKLLRELLVDALSSFGKRLRAPVSDSRFGKSLGELGRAAVARSGSFGAIASGMVDALSNEMERQIDKMAVEVGDGAVSRLIEQLIDYVASPGRSADQAALRGAVLEGLLGLTGPQLAKLLRRNRAAEAISPALEGAARWLGGLDPAEADAWLERLASPLLDETCGDLLDKLGAREAVLAALAPAVAGQIRLLVEGAPFEAWLRSLEKAGAKKKA